ncbi:MAG: SPASM domain-containing protein [Candidatus Aegiribacteria sp.]|nr:SPASM domain-containing protein [Candidatus Aegiribacteria sp.]
MNYVVTKLNIDDYQESRRFFLKNGACSVIPMILQPASSKDLDLRPTTEQLELFLDKNYDILTSECGYEELYNNSKVGWVGRKRNCGAAVSEFAVGSDGTVYPCRMLMESEFAGGNMLEEDLEKIWTFSSVLDSVRKLTYDSIEECKNCDFFNICIGGCRGSAFKMTGNLVGWIGPELCHESMQFLRHKLVIAMRAVQEKGMENAE